MSGCVNPGADPCGKLIVGLTGMSGAGKSTVCRAFAESGFDVIDCDLSAREVVLPGSPALDELRDRLSPELILPDGTLDRRKTAELIFHSEEKRALFNKIIYPYITYNIAEKLKRAGNCALLDAPTLFEARLGFLCASIVSVTADPENCVKRIMKRDGIPEELARARLKSQHGADFYRQRSSFCIENNGTQQQLAEAAQSVISQLKGGK